MITNATSTGTLADQTDSDAGTDWVLRLTVDSSGRVQATGISFVEKSTYQVFVDGLLHDRDELAQTARLSNQCGDEELVLAAYERCGEGLLSRLRGSFTVAIVDRARNLARVVRDPVGSRPLFYAEVGCGVAVASSQQALLATAGVSRALNRVALADHLCVRWPNVEETYFESLKRVPPGCQLIYENGRTRVDRHWDNLSGPLEFLTEAEAERFDEQLARAVARCFSAGRVGIFLSGGFDSVSVAAVAADYARLRGHAEPVALSLAFPHAECDERLVQTSVARKLGLPLELLGFMEAVGPRGPLAEVLELTKWLHTPLFNTWAPAYQALSRRARGEGVRTIITGEGGDEWLNVSPYLTADLIRRGDLAGIVRTFKTSHRFFDVHWAQLLRSMLWTFGLRPLASAGVSALMGKAWDKDRARRRVQADPAWIAPNASIRAEQKHRALATVADARPTGGFYARELRQFINDPLMSICFEGQHELGRRVGVRYLHPYWDPDLVEHMYRTPPKLLTKGNRTKALVRAAVDRRFPGLGFERQRKVLALSFFGSLAAAEARRVVPPFVDFSALGELGVVEPAGARAFVEGAFDQSTATMVRAWRLVVLEAWTRARLANERN